MKIIFILLGLCFLCLEAKAQGNICVNTGQIAVGLENSEMWIGLSKHMSITAAEGDFKGFCEWNRMDRATGSLSRKGGEAARIESMTEYRMKKIEGDRDQAASALLGTEDNFMSLADPWMTSMMGHPELKARSGHGTFFQRVCMVKEGCRSSLIKAFKDKDLRGNYFIPDYKTKGPINVSQTEIIGACGFLNPLATISCASASNKLIKWVEIHQHKNTQITAVPLIKETLADERLTPALHRTVIKLYERFETGKIEKEASIFSDLTEELKKEGLSSEEAKKQAVKILGAISSGGPNFARRINFDEVASFPDSCRDGKSCNLNGIFMQALAEGMPHADTLMMQAGHPSVYSLPAGAGFPCDIGKSYHFWATAAWTDRLMDEGYSASAARAAVYSSHLGYHLRDAQDIRSNSLLSMPRYGSVENGIRLDLNLAAAGTSFAANLTSDAPVSLKMKEGFLETLKDGNTNEATDSQVPFERSPSNVYEWTNRVSAKTAFGFYP